MRAPGRIALFFALMALCSAEPARAGEEPAPGDVEALKATAFRQFADGEYAEGIRNMEAAYRSAPRPEFLFNIAVAYQKWGGHCPEALRAFRHFFLACGDCAAKVKAAQPYAEVDRRCLAQVAAESAEVTLRSTVRGATLRLAGEVSALSAPVTVRLTPGEHRVRVVAGTDSAEHVLHVPAPLRMAIELAVDDPLPPPTLLLDGVGASEVHVDDVLVHADGRIPLKRGPHHVRVASAAGVVSFELFAEDGQHVELQLGRAEEDRTAAGAIAGTSGSAPAPSRGAPHTLSWLGAGVALGGVVVGSLFTVETLGDLDREERARGTLPIANAAVVSEAQDAGTRHAIMANIGFGVALAGAALAVVSYLLEPEEGSPASAGEGVGAGRPATFTGSW